MNRQSTMGYFNTINVVDLWNLNPVGLSLLLKYIYFVLVYTAYLYSIYFLYPLHLFFYLIVISSIMEYIFISYKCCVITLYRIIEFQ